MSGQYTSAEVRALREKLIGQFADMMGDTYQCTRVWSAWSVGTMGEDDFESASEGDLPGELADVVIEMLPALTSRLEQDERAVQVTIPGWKWMRHPTWNDGEPTPVQMVEADGVLYYCPFDADLAVDLKWEDRDPAWEEIHPAPAAPEILGWIHEDELPSKYPYDAMFPYSRVDIVRMFPVFGPAAPAQPQEQAEAERLDAPPWWRKRADEIELAVASGMSAMGCYTQMRQLLDADRRAALAAQKGV